MMKKTLIYLSTLLLFIIFIADVNAEGVIERDLNDDYLVRMVTNVSAPSISVIQLNTAPDLIQVTGTPASGDYISQFCMGTTDNINASTTKCVKNPSSTNTKYYYSVKNGQYYFWVYGSLYLKSVMYKYAVKVDNSCTNQNATNLTGSGTVERCFYYSSDSKKAQPDESLNLACASGYTLTGTGVYHNGCSSVDMTVDGQAMSKRYCKVIYNYNCTKNGDNGGNGGGTTVAAASLTSLSVDQGSLSPAFSSGTKTYNVTVDGTVDRIKISATAASGSSFVNGKGSRTVNLSYGQNKIYVSVSNSANKVTNYIINVTRQDNRSSVNTLSSLSVSTGQLSPEFKSDVTSYSLNLDASIKSINVNATLTDSNSYFVEGFGPRTVQLNVGLNIIPIKVKSQTGKLKTYNIDVIIADSSTNVCSGDIDSKALLKEINLISNSFEGEMPKLEFDPNVFTYTVEVPYDVTSLEFQAYVQTEGDIYEAQKITGLEVNVEQIAEIKVTSKECSGVVRTYTIGITRQPETILSSNAELSNIIIEGHDEFKFEQNTIEYNLKLKKKEKKLDITPVPEEENTKCIIDGNEKLKKGSIITVICTAQDNINTVEYQFQVTEVAKGTNVFLVVIIIILILAVIVYLVLRLLGYKIYFNFSVIGAFFRSIGEKIKNIFNK